MDPKIQAMLELEKRGKLPEQFAPMLQEARKRGLIPTIEAAQPQAAATQAVIDQMPSGVSSVARQAGSGVNEGLSSLAGFPVDMVTAGINAGIGGVNKLAGTEIPTIKDPVGGSGTFRKALAPLISDEAPQNRGERYARRIGQEVGFGGPVALVTAGATALPQAGKLLANSTLADVAAGTAGQTAREIAPDSDVADALASIIAGGGTAALRGRSMRSRPDAPYSSTDEMFKAGNERMERAAGSGVQLTQEAQEELFDRLYGRLKAEKASLRLHPRAYGAVEEAKNWPSARPIDIEETRRVIGRDVASNADEAPIGVALKKEIEEYLNSLDETKVLGGNVTEALGDLQSGRRILHQAHKARAVEGKEYRAKSRAATSGTGGNEVNAMRQNVRSILDNEVAPTKPGQRSGYTPDEIAQMEKIVFGTKGQNMLRQISRLAPSAGALPSYASGGGGLAGIALALSSGNPLPLVATIPGSAGEIAKKLAERSTKAEITELLDIMRRGGVAAGKKTTQMGEILKALGAINSADAVAP